MYCSLIAVNSTFLNWTLIRILCGWNLFRDLSSSVQDVQETWFGVDDSSLLVSIFNGGVVIVNEVVLDILQSQGWFTHASVPQHHDTISKHTDQEKSV